MDLAYKQAEIAYTKEEIPVGCVVVKNDSVIASTHNQTIFYNNPTKHAEIIALGQSACHLNTIYLDGCSLYVTMQPCSMCLAAIKLYRIDTIYFGAYSSFLEKERTVNIVGGVNEDTCTALLSNFFKKKRLQES